MPSDQSHDIHDSGYNHLKPLLAGLMISLIAGAIAMFFMGLPR